MIQTEIKSLLPKLIKIRKELHKHPELGLLEVKTTETIIDFLKANAKGQIHKIKPTGVLFEIDSGKPGKVILIRGDIDALPIEETNTFEHRSINQGISHKCGHDGHTTILLGLAAVLTKQPISSGKVCLIFQPSEENGKGAEAVLKDDYFKSLSFDYVFALHNLPGFSHHEIVLKENNFNANVKTLIINFNGKTAHAAEPEHGHNPSLAIAETIQECEHLTQNVPASKDFFLITPAYVQIGQKAYGISPGFGTLHLTIRSWDLELFDRNIKALQNTIHSICQKYELTTEYSWTEVFYANINNKMAVDLIKNAADRAGFQVNQIQTPFKWGEDFGLFTQKYKGAMFGVGAGQQSPALHNPDYDFPDEILPTAISTFYHIIQQTNNQ